jgi:hypothetical protein
MTESSIHPRGQMIDVCDRDEVERYEVRSGSLTELDDSFYVYLHRDADPYYRWVLWVRPTGDARLVPTIIVGGEKLLVF